MEFRRSGWRGWCDIPRGGLRRGRGGGGPVVADEGIDEEALVGGAGEEAVGVFVLEGGELFAALAIDELGVGVEAGFESVLGGHGFAFGSAGSGGFKSIEAV